MTPANTARPVVDGIVIPTKDTLFAMGYGGGYPHSASYAEMLSRWAESKCYVRDGVEGFCDTATRAGLLRDPHSSANDPWGVKATYHCLTGRGDCGEAIVSGVITVATLAVGSTGRALMARGASRAAATEVEAAAATLLKAACSFSPDTLVLLKNGKTKPISEVKPGDEVAAADPGTGKRKGGKPVTDRFAHQDDDLVDVTVRSSNGRTSVLRTTADHPFWKDTLQTWTTAAELRPGDRLNTATDTHARVVGVTDRAGSTAMYNLTVDELHTYYVLVGSTTVLVHNECPPSIALGYTRTADNDWAPADFADRTGAKMYEDWGDGNWTSVVKEAVDPKSTVQIHFNLEGIDDPVGLARSMDGVASPSGGDYTAWELSQIKNAPASVQARVTWYDEYGDVVSSPFGG